MTTENTPPAAPEGNFDVREALAAEAWAAYQLEHGYSTVGVVPDVGADFWAGFDRICHSLSLGVGDRPARADIVAALEAAQEARS